MEEKDQQAQSESPSSERESTKDFFDRIGIPLEDVTDQMVGKTLIIPSNKSLQDPDEETREQQGDH